MSRRDRRDGERRPGDRRDSQPDDEQQRHVGEPDPQESDSLTALKAILGKVAAALQPLQLSQDECVKLVEQLYGSVLEMDVKLAGETDDKRKAAVLAHIQNTAVTRGGDNKIVVEFPAIETVQAQPAAAEAPAQTAVPTATDSATNAGTDADHGAGTDRAASQTADSRAAEARPNKPPASRPRAPKPRPPATDQAAPKQAAGEQATGEQAADDAPAPAVEDAPTDQE